MEKLLQEITEFSRSIEDLEMFIFLFLLFFTFWFIVNTVKYYKGEKKKVKNLYRFAKEGEVESQYQLAKCYQKGNVVKRSCNQAAFWFYKAAYSGDEQAKVHLEDFLEKRNRLRNRKKC